MFDEFKWTGISERRNELTRKYEPFQIELLRALSRRCSDAIFLDIGANIGVYSVLLSREKNISETHAFEALLSLSSEMQKNLNLNGLSDSVTVHQVVLSDETGEADFVVCSDYAGDGGVRDTHQFTHLPYDRIDKLPKFKLDDLLETRQREVIIKVDVEGHELNVLKGAEKFLVNNKGFLQVEVLKDELMEEVEKFLVSLGWYRLFKMDHDVYFSNVSELRGAQERLEILECAFSQFIDRTRAGTGSPARRRILPGVVLEMRQSYVKRIKKFLGRSG
jgi:FkbM family methyltransferase